MKTMEPWICAGPLLAVLACVLAAIPAFRPRALKAPIGWTMLLMVVPVGIAWATESATVGLLALTLLPIVALVAVGLFTGYVILCRDRRFPAITGIPTALMLIAAAFDFYSVWRFAAGLGGASC